MTQKLIADLQMRTPLWTGDVDRTCQWIRETSLLGCLRWWYEALLRGYGVQLPHDEDGKNSCEVKDGIWEDDCPVCRLFGCTGWARRFKLSSSMAKPQKLFFAATNEGYSGTGNWLWRIFGGKDTGGTKYGKGRNTDFTYGVEHLWADRLKLTFSSVFPNAESSLDQLAYLLYIVIKYGGLSAKLQHGFGQFTFNSEIPVSNIKNGKQLLLEYPNRDGRPEEDKLPNFKNFFSMTFSIPEFNFRRGWKIIGDAPSDYHFEYIPGAFSLRYRESLWGTGLRIYFKQKLDNKDKIHTLMGNSRPGIDDTQRSASNVFVGHPYLVGKNYHVKVFGFLPPGLKSEGNAVSAGTIASWTEECFKEELFKEAKLIHKIFWEDIENENF